MSKFVCIGLVLLISFAGYAQTNFRTNQSGLWNVPTNWDVETPNGSNNWVTAGSSPTNTANTIVVFNDMIVSSNITIDQTTVSSGASISVNDLIILTLNNGTSTDLSVSGTLFMLGESALKGTGNLQITATGALHAGSLNGSGAIVTGTSAGNIQVSSRSYLAGATISYDGAGPQFIGNGQPATVGVNVIINNPNGLTLMSSSTTVTVGGNLTLSSGGLIVANNNLKVTGNATMAPGTGLSITSSAANRTVTVSGNLSVAAPGLTITSGAAAASLIVIGDLALGSDLTISSGTANASVSVSGDISGSGSIQSSGTNSNVSINGSGALTNAFPFASGASLEQITLNRSSATLTFPYQLDLKHLKVSAGDVVTNVDLILNGDLNLGTGTSFDFSGHDLTMQNGHYNNTLSGGFLKASSTSNLTVNGTGAYGTISFAPGFNTLNSITLDRPTAGSIVTLNSAITVNSALTLTDGTFTNTSGLTVGPGLQLTRTSNSSLTGSAPMGGPYDVIYSGVTLLTGFEKDGNLRNLTSNASTNVNLNVPVTASGDVTINTGLLNCGANALTCVNLSIAPGASFTAPSVNLTLTGNLTNNGTFNKNNGTVVFAGNSLVLGTLPTFQNVSVTGTFNGGSGFTLQGNLTNNGTFNAGGSTIQMTGSIAQAMQGASNTTIGTLTVNKTLSSTVTVSGPLTVTSTLNLTIGKIDNASAKLSMGAGSTFVRQSGTTFTGAAPAGGAYDLNYYGSGGTTTTGNEAAGSLQNVTNDLTGSLVVAVAMSIPGTLTLNSGVINNASGLISMGNNATITRNGTSSITGLAPTGGPYNVIYNTATGFNTGAESKGSLKDVTNNSSATVTIANAMTVTGTLYLNSAALTNAGGQLTMGGSSTINRVGTATMTGIAPAGGPYNLIYSGTTFSTGVEAGGSLNNVTSNATGTITQSLVINSVGSLSVNSGTWSAGANTITIGSLLNAGTLNAPSTTLTLAGNLTDNGTFNHNGGTIVFNGNSSFNGSSPTWLNHIQLNAGKTLTAPAMLNVDGNIAFGAGSTFNHSSGVVALRNGASQSADAQGARFYGITVNKTGGSVSLLSALNLANILSISTATDFGSNGFLTVLSQPDAPGDDVANDGSIGAIAAGGSVSGNVTVQRFLTNKGLGNRYVTPTVANVLKADLEDDFVMNSGTVRFYDESVKGPIGNGYTYFLGADYPLEEGRGYLFYLDPLGIQWDATGLINTGPFALPVSYTSTPNAGDGWNLVGNPFPSPIKWDNVAGHWSRSNVDPVITVPDIGGSTNYTYNYTNGAGNLPQGIIATGQAFWVHLSAAGSLSVNETAKTWSPGGTFYRKKEITVPQVTISLTDGKFTDNSFLVMDQQATNGWDKELDGIKLINESFSVYFLGEQDRVLSMNAISGLADDYEIPLAMSFSEPGVYHLRFSGIDGFHRAGELYLVDKEEGTALRLTSSLNYTVAVSAKNVDMRDRFLLSMKHDETLTKVRPVVVYPNPARESFRVDAGNAQVISVELVDMTGKVLMKWTPQADESMDLTQVPNGPYLIRILSLEGLTVRKLIRN